MKPREAQPLVIVTGGSGFIGGHTVETLASKGYRVLILDTAPPRVRPPSTGYEAVDVSSREQVLGLVQRLRSEGVEAIIHLAAVVSLEEARRDPWRTLDVNVRGTLNMLELARLVDAERIVYASSVAVYGEPKRIPVDEEHPREPANLYGATKLMGEMLVWRYMEDYGLKPVAMRYFNVYGPRMRPGPYAGVIYKFVTSLLRGEPPVIYGDGEQTRDFVYVEDVAEANTLALETRYTGPLNIGTGVETSINKLYKMICSIIGWCPEPRRAPPRPGDVRRSAADNTRAREALGWRPRTGLREGLEKTIEYYRAELRQQGRA